MSQTDALVILKQYHAKHPNRLHQFFIQEKKQQKSCLNSINYCPVCNIDLNSMKEELQQASAQDEAVKRFQWNTETKKVLLQALGSKCKRCPETRDHVLEIDHIVPLAWGGSNNIGNLQILCSNCHLKRHEGSTKDDVVCNDGEIHPEAKSYELELNDDMFHYVYYLWHKHIKSTFKPTLAMYVNITRGKVISIREADSKKDDEVRQMLEDFTTRLESIKAQGVAISPEVDVKYERVECDLQTFYMLFVRMLHRGEIQPLDQVEVKL